MNVLDRILADTRDLVARSRSRVSLEALREMPYYAGPTLSLAPALRRPELAVLAEIKRASPSKGLIRPDFDPRELALQYRMNGARALSVLTEPLHFKGALAHLAAVRQAVDLPLLRKDFIVDAYQLHEARAYGADAVLLIAAALDRALLADLHDEATALGLSCLVEVYDPAELDRIDFDRVRILGVNNRDLRTFEVDVDHSLRVFADVPANVVRVSESGLRHAADLAHLRRHGIDAVLIGETFMRASDPGLALRTLTDEVRCLLHPEPALRLVG